MVEKRKRRRVSLRKDAASESYNCSAVSLLVLPPELLTMVLERLGSLKEVARMRSVCSQFNAACKRVLRAAFLQLERKVAKQVDLLQVETDERVDQCVGGWSASVPPRYRGQKALQRQCICLYQAHLLSSLLGLLRACIWGYVTAGIQPIVFGELLDTYNRLLARLAAVDRSSNRKPATPCTIGIVQTMTLRVLQDFQQKVEKQLLRLKGETSSRYRILLPGITVLNILESCLQKDRTTPHIELSSVTDNFVRVQTTYLLDGCWLRIRSSTDHLHRLSGTDIWHLCTIMRQLVFLINNECLRTLRENIEGKISGDNTSGSPCISRHSFNIIEDINRIYVYGLNTFSFETESKPQLLIHIDVTCDIDLIPRSLLMTSPTILRSGTRVTPSKQLHPCFFELRIVLESIDLLYPFHRFSDFYVYSTYN